MVKPLVLVVVLCTPLPVLAQSKVYTNADLSAKPVTWTRTVTAAELAGLQARQFVAPLPPGPSVFVLDASERLGPMPAAYYVPTSSYADDLWRDPVSAYALQHPIEAAYGFRQRDGSSVSRTPRVHAPSAPTTTTAAPAAPTPPIVTYGATAGRRVR